MKFKKNSNFPRIVRQKLPLLCILMKSLFIFPEFLLHFVWFYIIMNLSMAEGGVLLG